MKKRTKRILFALAVLVFMILSVVAILYAQGYKYSFQDKKFVLTGAISLHVNTDAKVYLDDKLKSGTSFFGHSFGIQGLLPGKYKVTVQQDNYSTWQKVATVQEGLVIDFSRVLLLPLTGPDHNNLIAEVQTIFMEAKAKLPAPLAGQASPTTKPTKTPHVSPSATPEVYSQPFIIKNKVLYSTADQTLTELAAGVKGFSLSDNGNKLTWWSDNELWLTWLNDTNYQPLHLRSDKELITRFASTIEDAAWFRDEDHLVVQFGIREPKYKVLEIDTRGGLNVVEL